jgi:hypothetical protein
MHIPSIAAIAASALSLLPGAAGHVHHVPAPAQPSSATSTAPATASADCRDGLWVGPDGISVQGRPDSFDAGDNGAVYLWHDTDGWHIRTTDKAPGAHHYSGTVTASPGARFTNFAPVRNEKDDHVWITGDNVLHYTLTTYRGIDGLNFRVSACLPAAEVFNEALRFSMDYNGHEDDPGRIALGDSKRHPDAATFEVRRAV